LNVWNVLNQFELKLIQICYIQIRYIQIRIKIGWFCVNRTRGRNSSTSICSLNKRQKKFLIKSKRNRSQNNPPENNVEPVPAKSQITRLRFGWNWLHILFQRIVLEAAQIWRELAPHYFPADSFGGRKRFLQPTRSKCIRSSVRLSVRLSVSKG
jgi:hypothetical protein